MEGNMNTLIENLNHILRGTISIVVYFKLKNGEVRLADINNNVLPRILTLYKNKISEEIINKENLELLKLSEMDERKNVIYKYDFDKDREPFLSMKQVVEDEEIKTFSISNDTLENIDGIIAKISNSNHGIFLYTKFYPVNLIKPGKSINLFPSDHRLEMFDGKLIQITGKFDILRYNNEYYIKKHEILEKFYQFNDVITERAKSYFEEIIKIKIIENEAKLFSYLENNPSRARKFIKVMASSLVIKKKIPKEQLISFVSNNPKLKDNIETSEDKTKFKLKTNNHCNFFIKLLDDDFLKSELTQEEYEALAKNNV
ncbi:anti-phage protein KwaB [Methanosarcina mazei]|uniref:anti-phage protein KwaB n=1 Tax=Methanosarcina mazei TaxID=2209 RepID=UPI0012D4A517|nr:anti-phage protein KwaB [Methanosarcina mazei]